MTYIFNFWRCFRKTHDWEFKCDSLIGEWIGCKRCGLVDEYVEGMYMPKGYKDE